MIGTPCRDGDVVSVKLNDRAYTVAQMRAHGIMQFFDVARRENAWDGLDLDATPSLFFLIVAERGLRRIFVEKLAPGRVARSKAPVPKIMLSALIGPGNVYGADLIELTDDYQSLGARVLKPDLDAVADRDLIYRYELAGVYGDAEKLRRRLERHAETGVNWDDSKHILFKDLPPPPPRPGLPHLPRPVPHEDAIPAAPAATGYGSLAACRAWLAGTFARDQGPAVLRKIRPALVDLTMTLERQGAAAPPAARLAAFAAAFGAINRHADDIGTIERELILDAVYGIGDLVGLDRATGYAEAWRGDW